MKTSKLEIIKRTPYLFSCDVLQKDFLYLLRKLEKLENDMIHMKKIGSETKVDIDYILNAIENEKY